jgi:two-component system chemotaxis sensor kinase CheA
LKESVEAGKPVLGQKNLPDLLAKLKASVEGQSPGALLGSPEGRAKDNELDEILLDEPEPKIETKPEIRDITTKKRAASSDEKIKVSTARLDNLINMAGELVIAQLMVTEEVNSNLTVEPDLARKVLHQSKLVRELQELSMSMRMVPIHGVFQKMARLVRDLSRKAEKDVAFDTLGEDTELDRSIVDKIADPLVHMVRNSVDHGLEPRAERLAAGKTPTGRVELRAFHQAGNIVIEIEDDGRGLNKEKILKKAIDNGIVDANHELSDDEIFKLVFHAGLSTAQKITSVSGRGVGMDVVKKNIEALHGKIDISSTFGKGTVFTIRMPLTLAIIDGQIVTVGDDRYIIPINSIVRSLRPTAEQLSSVQGRGEMVLVRGQIMPMLRLYKLFNSVPTTEDPTKALVVVVEEDNKKCCLLVDELLDQRQVVIKSLGDGLGRAKGVSGGAIMGDGRVSLILDVPGLMKLAQG